jgi:hypothetical protein
MAQRADRENLPKATHFSLFRPDIGVEPVGKVLVQDVAIVMVDNRPGAIIHEKSSNGKAQSKPKEGNNGSPVFHWIFLVQP